MCESMKWAHLPNAGGLYDQDPELLHAFQVVFSERAEYQEAQEKKRQEEQRRKMGGPGRVAGRR